MVLPLSTVYAITEAFGWERGWIIAERKRQFLRPVSCGSFHWRFGCINSRNSAFPANVAFPIDERGITSRSLDLVVEISK